MNAPSNFGRPDLDILVRAAHVPAGEPTFLLRGRDPAGAAAVRAWAAIANRLGVPPAVIEQALQQADRMVAWPSKQLPDASHLAEHERLQLEYQFDRRAWNAGADGGQAADLLTERRGYRRGLRAGMAAASRATAFGRTPDEP